MMIAIAISIIVGIVIFKTFNNYEKWRKHIPINHGREWLIMAGVSSVSIIMFANESTLDLKLAYPISALMCAAFILFFFNGWYNTKRGFNWWFLGDVGKKSAWSDKFFKRIGPTWQKIIQIGLLTISVTAYIIFLK